MSTEFDMAFSPASLADFRALIRESVLVVGRDLEKTLLWYSRAFIKSARANTKMGRKLRDVIDNPDWKPRSGRARYLIRVLHQGDAAPTYIPANKRSDPRRVISRRGTAKNTWNGCLRRLGGSAKTVGGGHGSKYGTAKKRLQEAVPSIEIINPLSYLPIIHPNILEETMQRTNHRMAKLMTRQAQRLAKTWR